MPYECELPRKTLGGMRIKFVKTWSKVVNITVVGFAWEESSGRGGCVECGLSHLIYIYI
jgi:hypothetical protein